ncbi:MAG: NAD(P)-dependent alcohol dehydrogenase [Acidimicrobiia bacterium]|nr:NAD(P)-dependent alcohol dehydrogenase [Acidimicrobiia bacterium]
MKAIVQYQYGSAEVLQFKDIARPTPADDELLVHVRAASVGAWDWHDMRGDPCVMRLMGRSLRKPRKPVLGLDMAGEVVAVGADVSRFQPGDSVYGECGETFAEYTLAKEDDLALAPSGLSFAEAAAAPIAGATALLGLRDEARVQPGETVLIVGAAGGVGSFAVQIAKSMGAEVTGVCSPGSAELVRALGADHVIDYTEEDFTNRGDRYDVIFQIAGEASAWACRRALEPAGRLVLCSGDGGGRVFGPIIRIAGAMLISPFVSQKIRVYVAKAGTENLAALTELIENGDVAPVIDETYSLSEAAEAMQRFGHGHGPGKIVLTN